MQNKGFAKYININGKFEPFENERDIIDAQIKEIERLQNNWNTLKEWVSENKQGYRKERSQLVRFDTSLDPIIENIIQTYDKVFDVMRDLEQREGNNNGKANDN